MNPTSYLAGRGIADITGEPAECGLLGYGKADQQSAGLHTRLRSRAFVVLDETTGRRVLLIVNDLPLIFDSVHQAVLARLGDLYTAGNTMITATHTHCGPGGYAHHALYNGTTGGFRPRTFAAIVDGMVEAARRAHDDLAPSTLRLAHGELSDASANRSPTAFDRNPGAERAFFPARLDPLTTLLRMERDGVAVGVINWFATHNTSMTNRNRLISADNKGYAAYHWEREVHDVDYLSPTEGDFVSAFAQSNAGDMSPNLNLRPGSGPTEDEFENTRIIGLRQFDAAAKLLAEEGIAVEGEVDSRMVHVDLSCFEVRPEFTGDGRAHRTSRPFGGASALAGAWADGKAFPGFREGRNPGWDRLSAIIYRLSARLRDAQYPKALVLPAGLINKLRPAVAERFVVQLLRIGSLYLIGIPGEVTITAGLRLRRGVAAIVGADLDNVLVAGYSNGYLHYVTTPEEYDDQQYEGGSTLFGRWQLPALQQVTAQLAEAMRDGKPVDPGHPTPDLAARQRPHHRGTPDRALPGHDFGDVLTEPGGEHRPGDLVTVVFAGAYPNNDLRRGGTYLEVERAEEGTWQRIADDGDWSSTLQWKRTGKAGSTITVTWRVPEDTPGGSHRIRYHGDSVDLPGSAPRPFTGVTRPFDVHKGG